MRIVPALSVPVPRQIELFNASFEGYLAGFHPLDENRFGGLLRSGGIDLSRSLIALGPGDSPAGLAYVTVYAGTSRLAGMGVSPAFRRQGYARFLLQAFLQQAEKRASLVVELEVFEQNIPAVELYKQAGFGTAQRLFGYNWSPRAVRKNTISKNEDLNTFLNEIPLNRSYPEPYQFSPYGMITEVGDLQVKRLRTSWIAFKVTPDHKVLLKYLADEKDETERLKELVWAVAGEMDGFSWTVPQIVPQHIGEHVLEPLGFERLPLNQVQMKLKPGDIPFTC